MLWGSGTRVLDGVQPLLLGGLLSFELGLLFRIGFGGDLLVKLFELRVELLFEAGLAGVGFWIALLPRGIFDSLDLTVNRVETIFNTTHIVTRYVADLIPLVLDFGELLACPLRGFLIGDRYQSLGLLQQFFLLGEVLFLRRVDLLAVGLTGIEERVRGFTELGPQGIVIAASGAAGTLPTVHELIELV